MKNKPEFLWSPPLVGDVVVGIVQFHDTIIIATQRGVYRMDYADNDEKVAVSQVEFKP